MKFRKKSGIDNNVKTLNAVVACSADPIYRIFTISGENQFQMAHNIELRDARFSDYAAIAAFHAESWRQHYRGILDEQFLNNEVYQDRLDVWYKRLKSPAANQKVTVAMLDKDIVGFSCVFVDDDPVLGSLLDNLHVSARMHGSGIGTRLMKACAKFICDNSDSTKMYLWVYEQNVKARQFYERLGGTHFKTVQKESFDGRHPRVCAYTWNDVSIFFNKAF